MNEKLVEEIMFWINDYNPNGVLAIFAAGVGEWTPSMMWCVWRGATYNAPPHIKAKVERMIDSFYKGEEN